MGTSTRLAGPIAAALLLGAAAVPTGRTPLGIWSGWGAFRDEGPRRCFAIATPARTRDRPAWRPFASVGDWPGRGRRRALFIRLSALRDEGVPVTLSVGERRFRLAGTGSGVWSPDPATDRAVTAALRGERSMSIEAADRAGRPFADTYLLAGAATAIDAATLGCLG